ncbi:elongation factor GreAB [Pontibacillus chungwhensis BH030062]|uniref:Elongation factor GreAB n=1 Tax=Pontibacillus chungwhensis BH030062 TaxID=1385513 RepID=A0A0A2UQK0_9BACI|nr:hypothetical protein [Pontibacillus chungwhensis]KGP90224.1 elongation factor GreAB [Pontibacillus chungwhensis BH030062]
MKQLIRLFLFSLIMLSLAGCSFSNSFNGINEDNPTKTKDDNEITEIKIYKGEKLDILVVGDNPNIREKKNISFTNINLENLTKRNLDRYDAVFIMPKYLSETSEKRYNKIYKQSKIPFFFVGSKASTIPFVDNSEVTYETYADRVDESQTYISGLLYKENDKGYFAYKYRYLHNGKNFVKDNVSSIYSNVFRTIESIKDKRGDGSSAS